MSVENLDNHQPLPEHSRKRTNDNPSVNKKSILYNKSFLVDIVDKIVSSKVEKLIDAYGGKILQMLEKNVSYLISDKMNDHSDLGSSSKKIAESKTLPCSKCKNSNDLINKANLLNIQILSPKQFQHWLKSLLKKVRVHKKPTDKVASVLRGKVSLKIESLDQGQCPVFEFIPKWPDLGDNLCKKKTKIAPQKCCNKDNSIDEYNSSDQYSTSEIGGMCELCDMPFMNYKEHINTKKHLRESQDEKKFHELDELINERPLNVIFNQFRTESFKCTENKNCILETSSSKESIQNTIISIVDNNSANDQNICVPCSFGDNNTVVLKEHTFFTSLKRKCCSDTNISFVPQKRPSYLRSPPQTDINFKKTKLKRKKHKKLPSKDIYKVEVVNTELSSSKEYKTHIDKPPVIIRLKRVKCSKKEISISKLQSDLRANDSIHNNKIQTSISLDQRNIRVIRKRSITYESKRTSSSKEFSQNLKYSFEQPQIFECNHKDIDLYYPTKPCFPISGSSIECIPEKCCQLEECNSKCTMLFEESIKTLSNFKSKNIRQWLHNVPNKIQDDLSFDFDVLTPFTDLLTKASSTIPAYSKTILSDSLLFPSTSSNSS